MLYPMEYGLRLFFRLITAVGVLIFAIGFSTGCAANRLTGSGATCHLSYYPDSRQPDQGATTGHAGRTICDAVKSVGHGKIATIYLRHTGAMDTTLYTFDTSLSLADDADTSASPRFVGYNNIYLQIEPGARLVRKTGDEILKLYSPACLILPQNQQITDCDMIAFMQPGVVYPQWWGGEGKWNRR